MVGPDGRLPLPWLEDALNALARAPRGHALLLHGPRGAGQFELALVLAQRLLCEATDDSARPCGRCPGCRLVQARTHPDLAVVLPEALREPLGWQAGAEADAGADSKRKPSREIKVDDVRLAIGFAQRTSARGGSKVVVVHPAEAMNAIAANALLKTLEEPAPALRFVLCSSNPDDLVPTVRSRCQPWRIALPAAQQAAQWLEAKSVRGAATLLAAAGGSPLEALSWSEDGIDAATWLGLAEAVRKAEPSALLRWPAPLVIEAMQKLCHDSACVTMGAAPRWLDAKSLRPVRDPAALTRWWRELVRLRRDADHPWNAPLLIEALVAQGSRALR